MKENAKIENLKCDIFGDFQTLCTLNSVKKSLDLGSTNGFTLQPWLFGDILWKRASDSESRVQSGSIYENNPEIKSNGVLLTNLHSLSWLCLAKLQKDYFLPHEMRR